MEHKPESVELTVLCLIQDKNRVLLQNRIKEDWKGYTFPGGHVEAGESFVDAVIREMKEETGLTVISPKMVGIKQFPIKDGRYIVLLFKADDEVNTVEDFHDLLKVINDPELTEFQYVIEDDRWITILK